MTTLSSTLSSSSSSPSSFDVHSSERELQMQVREAMQFQSEAEAADLTKRLLAEATRVEEQHEDIRASSVSASTTPLAQLLDSSWRTNPKRLTSGTATGVNSSSTTLAPRPMHLNTMSGLYPPMSTYVDTIDSSATAAVSSVHAELSSLHESLRSFQRARVQQTINFRHAAAQPSQTYFIAEQPQQPHYLPRSTTPSQSVHPYRALTPAAAPVSSVPHLATVSQFNRTQPPFESHSMQMQHQQQPQVFSPSSLAAQHALSIPVPTNVAQPHVDTAAIQQQLLQLQKQQQLLMMQLQQSSQSATPLSSISPPISSQPSVPNWSESQLNLMDLQSLARFQ